MTSGALRGLLVGLLVLVGCGPLSSTSHLLDADVQLEAARVARAEREAPYEWTLANLYLHKAREEVGYSDYEQGVSYAQKASKYARAAKEAAQKAARRGEPPPGADLPPPLPPPPGSAP